MAMGWRQWILELSGWWWIFQGEQCSGIGWRTMEWRARGRGDGERLNGALLGGMMAVVIIQRGLRDGKKGEGRAVRGTWEEGLRAEGRMASIGAVILEGGRWQGTRSARGRGMAMAVREKRRATGKEEYRGALGDGMERKGQLQTDGLGRSKESSGN
ncbi:unnamed protein product [Calypogeia fissa]